MTGSLKAAIAALTLLVLAASASAETALERLGNTVDGRGWEAVGLVDTAGQSTCTGALIRPDLVLTAAHCLYDLRGQPIAPHQVEFRAAWRNGQSLARRVGKAALVHPDYVLKANPGLKEIAADIGLLALDQPIPGHVASPFGLGARPYPGDTIWLVSYGAHRNDAPSLERDCHVKASQARVHAFTCAVEQGSSGAPVFRVGPKGPEVVSVISALGMDGTSFGMDVTVQLPSLLADFDAGRGVYPAQVQGARRLDPADRSATPDGVRRLVVGQSENPDLGARFLRP